jgi:phage terminase large subunit-like protein
MQLTEAQRAEAVALLAERERRENYKLRRYFPDIGPYRRDLYPNHIAFFAAGARYPERLFLAGNRVGKTDAAAYEVACHLTGVYPDWWQGKRFTNAGDWWVAGKDGNTTRDIAQRALWGNPKEPRTGMIPAHLIVHTTPKPGVPEALQTISVRHVTGKIATAGFKTFEAGFEAFQGTEKQGIWLDEECGDDIYTECLLRTMTTNGIVLLTFTPLQGLTPLILQWLENGEMTGLDGAPVNAYVGVFGDSPSRTLEEGRRSKFVVQCDWNQVPHLSDDVKARMLSEIQESHRDARRCGIPSIGAGKIYPFTESDIRVKDFLIPDHWPRAYGMDAGGGSKSTAAVWGAKDPQSQTIYITSVYKRAAAEPVIHATAIKARGAWIPGVGDCAALIMTDHDAEQLITVYKRLGLNIELPDKAVETGIQEVWELFGTGGLKIFESCTPLFEELRLYRRDKHGRVVKENDHLLDALRYLIRSGRTRMKTQAKAQSPLKPPGLRTPFGQRSNHGWMT